MPDPTPPDNDALLPSFWELSERTRALSQRTMASTIAMDELRQKLGADYMKSPAYAAERKKLDAAARDVAVLRRLIDLREQFDMGQFDTAHRIDGAPATPHKVGPRPRDLGSSSQVVEVLRRVDATRDWALPDMREVLQRAGMQADGNALNTRLMRMVQEGSIERVARGVYRLPQPESASEPDGLGPET